MGRLIDADALIKKILQEAAHQARINHPENARGLKYAAELMENQPTAYDLNKVVEYLEKAANKFDTPNDGDVWIRNGIFLAKQIVKGAVKDE